MKVLWRYFKLYGSFLRICAIREMESRGSFVASTVLVIIITLLPLLLVGAIYSQVTSLAGWTLYQYLVLVGTFQIMSALVLTMFGQNMFGMPDYVRKGELDFFLLKPINAQFMLSTRYVRFIELPGFLPGAFLIGIGLANLHMEVEWWRWLLFLVFMASGTLISYALWFMLVTPAIWVIKIETQELFMSLFDLSRYHPSMLGGVLKTILVYILPIGVVVATPADMLLKKADWQEAAWAIVVAVICLWVATRFWQFAQTRYYGASS